jgi:hypothetical protein
MPRGVGLSRGWTSRTEPRVVGSRLAQGARGLRVPAAGAAKGEELSPLGSFRVPSGLLKLLVLERPEEGRGLVGTC